jgi:hypothetical protein
MYTHTVPKNTNMVYIYMQLKVKMCKEEDSDFGILQEGWRIEKDKWSFSQYW